MQSEKLKQAGTIWETVTLSSFANLVGPAFESSWKILYFDQVLEKESNHKAIHSNKGAFYSFIGLDWIIETIG